MDINKANKLLGKTVSFYEKVFSENDLEIADQLAREVIKTSMDDLSIPARDLLEQITAMQKRKLKSLRDFNRRPKPRHEDVLFTRRELMDFTSWRKTRLHIHMRELIESEYVVLHARRLGGLQYYRLMPASQPRSGSVHLGG